MNWRCKRVADMSRRRTRGSGRSLKSREGQTTLEDMALQTVISFTVTLIVKINYTIKLIRY